MTKPRSKVTPTMNDVTGVSLGCDAAGIRYRKRKDLLLVSMPPKTTVAGVFTRSAVIAAPVQWCRRHIAKGYARGLLVNAGNANACTGRQGEKVAAMSATAVAQRIGCSASEVMLASTGVIGEPMKPDLVLRGIGRAYQRLGSGSPHWHEAATAITTTDTFPKAISRRFEIDGRRIIVNGIAKGSGMIAPNMATMLGFFFTDAEVSKAALGRMLRAAVEISFHRISVDGDTSTNDTVLMFATGAAGKVSAKGLRQLGVVLNEVAAELARQIVRDGEGASKFVVIKVSGAASKASARRAGFAIANSPLVKTALSGEDANWGRIAMAVGKSGERLDLSRLGISIGGVALARKGTAVELGSGGKRRLSAHMRGREVLIGVYLGVGRGADEVWTCDLSHDYVAINGDYRS